MATIDGLTATRMLAIEAESVVSGSIDESGHLILARHDGSTIDAGPLFASVPSASTSTPGIVQLSTNTDVDAGTSTALAVTPAALKHITDPINTAISDNLQPKDADLTTIASLTPTDDDVIQHKSGAWVNRSMVQLLADLIGVGAITNQIYNGTTYGLAGGAITYIGNTDPGGSAANGSVWFDTSGA